MIFDGVEFIKTVNDYVITLNKLAGGMIVVLNTSA